jgi:hypothetical protein
MAIRLKLQKINNKLMFTRRASKEDSKGNKEPTSKKKDGLSETTSRPSTAEEKEKRRSRSNSIKTLFGFAKTSPDSGSPEILDSDKDVSKHLPTLSKFVVNNDLVKFKETLAKRKVEYMTVDKVYERNVFHWCSLQQNPEFISALCSELRGKDDFKTLVNAGDINGRTPLILVR